MPAERRRILPEQVNKLSFYRFKNLVSQSYTTIERKLPERFHALGFDELKELLSKIYNSIEGFDLWQHIEPVDCQRIIGSIGIPLEHAADMPPIPFCTNPTAGVWIKL